MARFMFKYEACWFLLLLITSFTAVLTKRQYGIHLSHKCVSISSSSDDKLPIIMLHGITGSKESWNGLYQAVAFLTGRRVCVYDARNHGDSGWNNTFTVEAMADDLSDFMADMKMPKASLVGHSMGGSTIMKFALKYPSKAESIFVEDTSTTFPKIPKEINDSTKSTFKLLLNSLSAIPADADEETAKKAVIDYIINVTSKSPPPEFFKLFPLRCKDGVWQWKANLEAFLKAFDNIYLVFGKMEGLYDGRSFFIYGEDSTFKVMDDKENILKLFPNAEFFGVKGADHVVHAHATIYLNKLVKFLKQGNSQRNAQLWNP